MVSYYSEKEEVVSKVMIAFRERDLDFWPKGHYRGNVLFDGALIDRDTPYWMFNHKKRGREFKRGYFDTIYHYRFEGAYIGIDLDREKRIASLSIATD